MNSQRVNITLPQKTLRELRMSIPQGKRSRFIASALEEKLKKEKTLEKRLRESLKANYAFDKKVAKDWEITELEGWPE